MNDFQLVHSMKDRRWTNAIKYDRIKQLTELAEADKNVRRAGLDEALRNQETFIYNLTSDIQSYQRTLRDSKNMKNILGTVTDRNLVARYRHLQPNEIKSSVDRHINKTRKQIDLLAIQNETKLKQLEEIQVRVIKMKAEKNMFNDSIGSNLINDDIIDIDEKIKLVTLNINKTNRMIDLTKKNLSVYDTLIGQLEKDAGELASHIMNTIKIGTYFKEDEANFIQNYIDEKALNSKRKKKTKSLMARIGLKMDMLEVNRKKLMENDLATEMEKLFEDKLPQMLNTNDDESENGKLGVASESSIEKFDWFDKMQEHGMLYFADESKRTELLKNIENDSKSGDVEYKFPENPIDYIALNNTPPVREKIAVDFLLKELEFNNINDLMKSVEDTKNDLTKMNKLKILRTTLWNLVTRNYDYIQETAKNLNLMTDNSIEFNKKENILKPFIEKLNKKMRGLEETKNYYLRLFNDMYFYLDNFKSKFDKVEVFNAQTKGCSILNKINENIKQKLNYTIHFIDPSVNINFPKSNTQDNIIDTSTFSLSDKCQKIIFEIKNKIRWCMKITVDFDQSNLNWARSIYDFKYHTFIQEYKKPRKPLDLSRKRAPEIGPKYSQIILTREQTKKQANNIVKYFETKDLDSSKNKRKPISFRKKFI